MQKKGSILFLLVAVSILVAGCQLTGSSDKGTIPDSSSAFKGKDGLVLSFFDDAPPEKMIPNSDFKIAVLLENKGAADITCDGDPESCGFFLVFSKEPITGITPSTGKLKDALDVIDGKSKLIGKESYLSGGRAAIEFSASVAKKVDTTTTSTITVDACYPYKTSLSASVCVQTAHYTVPEKSRVCELKTLSFSNQGAPVAITKIEQESILSGEYVKPRLKIYLSDVGKGTVIDKDKESLKKACTVNNPGIGEIVGKVTIEEATLSGEKLDCQQGKGITLTGVPKKDVIECILGGNIFKANAANNLVSPLKIVLGYGYQTAISKDVKIDVIDSPPRIKRFSIIPLQPKQEEPLSIFVSAEDDIGLKEIQLLYKDEDGKDAVDTYPCKDALSCSTTPPFEKTAPKNAGDVFIYKAMAVDTSGKPSDISIASGTVGGTIVKIELPKEAPAGTKITITATAKSTGAALKSLDLIDLSGKVLETYDCKNLKDCSKIFERTAPAKGYADFYAVVATDSKGIRTGTEWKSIVGG